MIRYTQQKKLFARHLRNNMTPAERKLWREILSKDKLGYRFLRQKPLDNFVADFYSHQLKLVIEVDGSSHDNAQEYDKVRTEKLESYGLKVIRFNNNEIMDNIEGVYERLGQVIRDLCTQGISPAPLPRRGVSN